MRKALSQYKKIIIKIGSALLVDQNGLKADWLKALCDDIAHLKANGTDVLVVSSGAIAMGRTILSMPDRVLKLEESQAAAAIGQIALARAWSENLSAHGVFAGQILLTLFDTEERRRYLNARATMSELLELGAVPIINENDTVATNEIRYGDNDRLAARVATMVGADLLILLSDIDGLYTAPPAKNPDAKLLDVIEHITPEIENMAGGAASNLSRGGMKTKVDAAKIATASGCAMIITSGKKANPITALDRHAKSSWFAPSGNPVTARHSWIAGQLAPMGIVTIDQGAEKALRDGNSLLPAGVKHVEGEFSRGDPIAIHNQKGQDIGHGIARYDSEEAKQITGLKSSEITRKIGYSARAAMIHRDDLVIINQSETNT